MALSYFSLSINHSMQPFRKILFFLLYGTMMAILIFTLKWLEWKFMIVDNSMDIYIGLIAVFFTILGVWISTQLSKTKVQTIIIEREIMIENPQSFTINEVELNKLNLSKREHEVLQLVTKGYSNAAIAESLFLSLSTVKTHVSNLLFKMDVKSRAQAIEKAKRLKITQ